jgi:hypothetical protein
MKLKIDGAICTHKKKDIEKTFVISFIPMLVSSGALSCVVSAPSDGTQQHQIIKFKRSKEHERTRQ